MEKWFYLVGGGVLGTLAGMCSQSVVYHKSGGGFPYGTLVINLSGCFLVGFFDTVFQLKTHFSHGEDFFDGWFLRCFHDLFNLYA